MRINKLARIIIFAAVGIFVIAGGVFLYSRMAQGIIPKASGDYTGMTQEEAVLAECEARNLHLSDEELAQAYRRAEQDFHEYQELGETNHTVEELYQDIQTEFLEEKLIEEVVGNVRLKEDEIRKWYDARYDALAEVMEDTPGVFKSQQEYYDKFGGVQPLIIPEGYIRVKHILVEDKITAEEVMEKIKNGGDFAVLIDEYCIDAGMFTEPYASLGYLVGPYESTVDYFEEFKTAALLLNAAGDCSEIIETAMGYEIIQLTGKLNARSCSYEEVRGSIENMLIQFKKEQRMKEILRQWTAS